MPKTTDNATVLTRYNFDAPINQAEEEGDKDLEISEEMARETERKADNIQPYQEARESVKERLTKLLHEHVDIFSWSYRYVPGLDTEVVVHILPLKESFFSS